MKRYRKPDSRRAKKSKLEERRSLRGWIPRIWRRPVFDWRTAMALLRSMIWGANR